MGKKKKKEQELEEALATLKREKAVEQAKEEPSQPSTTRSG